MCSICSLPHLERGSCTLEQLVFLRSRFYFWRLQRLCVASVVVISFFFGAHGHNVALHFFCYACSAPKVFSCSIRRCCLLCSVLCNTVTSGYKPTGDARAIYLTGLHPLRRPPTWLRSEPSFTFWWFSEKYPPPSPSPPSPPLHELLGALGGREGMGETHLSHAY